jgi:translation initiation factor 2 subunit 2
MEKKDSAKPASADYDAMLRTAMEKMPKKDDERKRFEVPQIVSMVQGNKTIIRNFGEILSALRRDSRHLSKFFFKQLATPGNIEGNSLILQRKVQQSLLQKKLEEYIKEYVYCKACGEPDTLLTTENRITSMRCEACGARSAVREV